MASYSGSDKRLQYLFNAVLPEYLGERQIGYFNYSALYEDILVCTVSTSPAVDEVIYDLSSFTFSYLEIVAANLQTSGEIWPIAHELNVNGTDLVYNGAHGTGTAYVTIHYTK